MTLQEFTRYLHPDTIIEVEKQVVENLGRQIENALDKEQENFDWEDGYYDAREIKYDEDVDCHTDEDVQDYILEEMERKYLENWKINGHMHKSIPVDKLFIVNHLEEFGFDEDIINGIEWALFDIIKEWFNKQ